MSKSKYFTTVTCGAGMRDYSIEEAVNEEAALELARILCIDLASQYGYYQDEDYFSELDSVYNEDSWCEDDEEYTDISELEYYVELYDPDEHDQYLS